MFYLDVANLELQAGSTYRIDFRADQIRDIQGYQLTLNLDPAAATVLDLGYGLAKAENFGLRYFEDGLIATSWNKMGVSNYSKEDILFSLEIEAKQDVRLSDILGISNRITLAEAYDQQDELLEVGIDFNDGAFAKTPFELHQNVPNPFRKETTIGFYLPEGGETTLSIHDASGRVIKLIRGEFAQGSNQIQLKRGDLGGSGVLYYTLTTGDHTATRKMILVK
jgi:hypothetical protein